MEAWQMALERAEAASLQTRWGLRAIGEVPILLIALWASIQGWSARRELDLAASWRLRGAVLQAVVGIWVCWLAFQGTLDPAMTWMLSVAIGVAAALVWFPVSMGLEIGFAGLWPEKLATLRAVGGATSKGRDVSRVVFVGCCLGAGLAVLDRSLAGATEVMGLVYPDPLHHDVIVGYLLLPHAYPLLQAVALASYQALLILLAVGIIVPRLERRLPSSWVTPCGGLFLALCLVNPGVMLATVLPLAGKLLLLFVLASVLTSALRRTDLLTVSFAAFIHGAIWCIVELLE